MVALWSSATKKIKCNKILLRFQKCVMVFFSAFSLFLYIFSKTVSNTFVALGKIAVTFMVFLYSFPVPILLSATKVLLTVLEKIYKKREKALKKTITHF